MPGKQTNRQQDVTSDTSGTDWEHLDRLEDEDIDTSDIPEPTPEDFARAVARRGLEPVARKQQVTLRIDADVLEWFKAGGTGYQSRINALLRAYFEAHRK
ncbi:MAG: BrnA antitoxin family protein [Gammaproteobacteria bacterium]|nr:BrnA antitoxin family protein [Gammaproteobacteria bacterium]